MSPRAYCQEGGHFPRQLLSSPLGVEGLIVTDNGGEPLHWEDGTIGIPVGIAELVREDESPVCAEHDCTVRWIHAEPYNSFCESKTGWPSWIPGEGPRPEGGQA